MVEEENQQPSVAHAARHQIKTGRDLSAVQKQRPDETDQQKQQHPRRPT